MKTILSLCDYSGAWSRPYANAGYRVIMVDSAHRGVTRNGGIERIGVDVRNYQPPSDLWGVLAAPPCTCFCRPAARWWKRQDEEGRTREDVEVFEACLRICQEAHGWWALENPPGRHQSLIGGLPEPAWQYQPYEYGDPWTKQTYIWGTARKPRAAPVKPIPTRRTPNGKTQGRIAFMSSTWKREREKTPAGFAKAFFKDNQ